MSPGDGENAIWPKCQWLITVLVEEKLTEQLFFFGSKVFDLVKCTTCIIARICLHILM